jgi:cytochrome c2
MRGILKTLLLLPALTACGEQDIPIAKRIVGGDADRGRAIIAASGCTACHVVPGIRVPPSHVGPSLAGFARRGYIGGVLPNGPDNLLRWLRDPPAVAPATAMPDAGLDDRQLRDVAAYLVKLR